MKVKLKETGKIITGNTPKTSEAENYSSNDIPFIKPSDIHENDILRISESEYWISEHARKKARILPPNSVLVTCIGIIGKVAINTCECAFNQQINAIIPDSERYLPEYIAYAILSKQKYLQEIANAPVVPIINKSQFADIDIQTIDIQAQKRVVDKLSSVSELIKLNNYRLNKLDELIKSRFVEMFGRIKTNDKGWNITTVKKIADVRGRVGWKGYKKDDLRESGPLVLGATHLTDNGDLDFSAPVHLSREKYEESPEIVLQKNDLIFTQRGNTIGKVGLVTEDIGEATINPCVLIIRPINVNPLYLKTYFIMDDTKDDMWMLNSGSAQPMITQKGIGEYHLILPPITLQNQFADFVTQVEKQKATIQQSIDKLETLKKSLMQEYFR